MLPFYCRYIDRLSTDSFFFFTLRLLQLLLIFFVVVYSSFFLARGSKTRMGWQGILIAESSHVAHKCVDGDEMLVLGRDWGHRQSASSLFTCHWLECVAFLRVGDCISLTLAKSWRNKMVLSVLISKRTWIKWNLFAFNLISLINQLYYHNRLLSCFNIPLKSAKSG